MVPLVAALAAPTQAAPLTFHTLQTEQGTLEYALLVPKGRGPHPAILALPPGPQTRPMVQAAVHNWSDEMVRDGYLVVSPVAPEQGLFTDPASHALIPKLLDHVAGSHRIWKNWYLYGISNGGRSALVVGAAYPQRFRSITVLPGAVADPATLQPITSIPVTWVVGSEDGPWVTASHDGHDWLTTHGGNSQLALLDGLGHMAFHTVRWNQLETWLTRR
ncbi:MAG: hypothetical protein KTR31_18100 [Myxococcales bacterium]|nr:hypothetical protein [Myxococcales bacterium]